MFVHLILTPNPTDWGVFWLLALSGCAVYPIAFVTHRMDQPTNTLVFGLGCIGAVAPEILRLYELRQKPPKEVFSCWYYIISIPMALLGGVVALLLPSVTHWAAFYAGISTPTVISASVKHRKGRKTQALANEQDNIIRAIDPTLGRTGKIIRASEPTKKPLSKAKQNFNCWIELIRDHADGLFI